MTTIDDLFETLAALRHPETGCHWDRSQSLPDMLKPLRSEVEELAEAIGNDDTESMAEELGDVLWNVLFLMDLLASERGVAPHDVMRLVQEKMIARHPHVFGDETASTPEEALAAYKAAKERLKNT